MKNCIEDLNTAVQRKLYKILANQLKTRIHWQKNQATTEKLLFLDIPVADKLPNCLFA